MDRSLSRKIPGDMTTTVRVCMKPTRRMYASSRIRKCNQCKRGTSLRISTYIHIEMIQIFSKESRNDNRAADHEMHAFRCELLNRSIRLE